MKKGYLIIMFPKNKNPLDHILSHVVFAESEDSAKRQFWFDCIDLNEDDINDMEFFPGEDKTWSEIGDSYEDGQGKVWDIKCYPQMSTMRDGSETITFPTGGIFY